MGKLLQNYKQLEYDIFRIFLKHVGDHLSECFFNFHGSTFNWSNFTSAFFMNGCHANPGADKKYTASSSYISMQFLRKFSNSSANSSDLHDHNTHLNFIFWNPPRLFSRVCSQHPWCYWFRDCWKIRLCLAMTFHWIFAKYPCTHMNGHPFANADKILWFLHHRICLWQDDKSSTFSHDQRYMLYN